MRKILFLLITITGNVFGQATQTSPALPATSGNSGKVLRVNGVNTEWVSPTKAMIGLQNVPNVDATNPANINQSSAYRLVSDAEKAIWNANKIAPTVSSLRTIQGATNDRLTLLGYYAKGDGGGQELYWDATSTETDNSGTVFQVIGVSTGRWKSVNVDIINVKCFGAKGDGLSDDTKSLQRLFNAVTDGTKIVFNGNKFNILDTLSLINKNNIVIDFNDSYIYQKTIKKPPLTINHCNNIVVQGGNFIGMGGTGGEFVHGGSLTSWNNVAAIYLKRSTNVSIRNNRISDFAGAGIYWVDSDILNITANIIRGIGASYIDAGDNNRGFAIGGVSDNFSRMDFSFSITDNDISGHAFGVFCNRANNLQITNNYIHDIPGQHGTYLIECSGVNISNNNFRNIKIQAIKTQNENYVGRGWAPVGTPNTSNYTVVGNTIDNAAQGIAFLTAPMYLPHNQIYENVNISGNTIKNVSEAGMVLQRPTSAVVIGNNIINSTKYGLRLEAFGGKISNNYIKNVNSSGIWGFLYKNTEFSSNWIEDCGYNNTVGGVGAEHPIYIFPGNTATNLPTDVASKVLVISNNDMVYFSSSDASYINTSIAAFIDARLNVEVYGFKTNSLKPFRTEGTLKGAYNNQFTGYYSSADTGPASPIYGQVKKSLYCNTDPVTAGWTKASLRGDICWNSNPATAGATIGWVCITSGTPGTWVPFGLLLSSTGNLLVGGTSDSGEKLQVTGDLSLKTAGSKIKIATGTNASVGTATLVSGTVTINTTAVTAGSQIHVTVQETGQYNGRIRVSARVAGTSFTVSSSDNTDTALISWTIIN